MDGARLETLLRHGQRRRTPTLVIAPTEPPAGEDGSHTIEVAGLGANPSSGASFLLDASLSPR